MCKIHQEDSWAGTDPGGGGHFFKITLKKLRYTRRPHPAKIHTLFKASGLKRHPVQDAQ